MGRVTDSAGAPLPSVTVTLSSPVLMNPQVRVTAAAGLFQFPTLPIGLYRVTLTAPGFSTAVREGIDLQAGVSMDVNIAMVKGSGTVVTSHTQMVDQRNTTVQASTQASVMANVGASRDIYSIMAVTPGQTIVGTVDVGGNQAGSQRSNFAYGYRQLQARNQYDGTNVTEGTSSVMVYFDYGAVAELKQTVAAADASMPVPGTFLNAIIKQGSNATHAGIYFDYENPSFQGHNVSDQQLMWGAGTGTRLTRYEDLDGEIGGKVIKDRFWYYVSLRGESFGASVTGFPAENPSMPNPPFYHTNLQNITEKLTWRLTKNNRITHFIGWNNKAMPFRNAAQNYWADSTYNQDTASWGDNVRWDSLITKTFSLTTMIAESGYQWSNHGHEAFDCSMRSNAKTILPCTDGSLAPRLYDYATTDSAGSYPGYRTGRRHWIAQTDGKIFREKLFGTPNNFSFGYMWEWEKVQTENYGPMGQIFYGFNSAGAADFTTPYQIAIVNGPTVAPDLQRHHGAYVSDQIKLGKRAVFTPGIRWDYYRDYEPAESIRNDAPFRGFYYAGAVLPNGYSIPATRPDYTIPARQVMRFPMLFAPRIGLAIDLTGKANTILKLSYGRYFSQAGVGIGAASINGQQYVNGSGSGTPSTNSVTFKWSDPTFAPFNWNQVGAYVTGQLPTTGSVAPNLKNPYLDEYTMFIDKQLNKTLSVRAGLVFKRASNELYNQDLGRPYSMYTAPITFYDNGPDGVKGTADDRGNTTVCCDIPTAANGGPAALPVSRFQVSNSAQHPEYWGWDASFNKRMSNHWMLSGGFAWNAYHIIYQGTTANADPNMPLQAYNNAANNSYWSSNARGSYQAKWGIVISPTVRYMQGQNADRVVSLTGLRIGSYSLIAEPWGSYRYDNIPVVDARVEKRLKFKEKYNFGVFFDAYNITNGNGRVTFNTTTGTKTFTLTSAQSAKLAGTYTYPLFGQPTNIVGPRVFRIGLKFNF